MYIDKSYLLSFVTEAVLDSLTAGDDPEANLEAAILQAQSDIDLYCANRTTVPLTEVPPVLKGICVDLTIYYLHSKTQSNRVPEWVQVRYENAMSKLKDISKGIGQLPFVQEPLPKKSSAVIGLGPDSVMNREMF